MMSTRFFRWGLLGAFLLQTALLAWMIVDRGMLLASGTEVRLSVVPVDPRDLLRGDYVVLSYEISRLNEADLNGDSGFDDGDSIFVVLESHGDFWKALAIFREEPSSGPFIRGVVNWINSSGPSCDTTGCRILDVDYGLGKFFVPEGEGRQLENLRNDQRMSVDVSLGQHGRSAIKRLLVDNKVRYEESFY